MPLREDILAPIAGDNPAGENLEYAPIYDQIKEARRVDDRDWGGAQKVADWKTVVQLASDAIATKSKDLQLAAWLTEALLRREGYAGLRAGLELVKALIDTYWDKLYPPIDDPDMRAMPVDWIATRLDLAIREAPLTKAGYSFLKYKESRSVGYEEEADTSQKQEARQAAIEDGKITAEVFDKAFKETSKDFYQHAVENLDACLEAVRAIGSIYDEKLGEYSPSTGQIRETLEEVRHTANVLYQKKREEAGELNQQAEPEPEPEPAAEPEPMAVTTSGAAAAPARAPIKKAVAGLVPADKDEVAVRLAAVAKFLREQDEYDPAPYLMLRGYRWGELRRDAPNPSQRLLEAPSSEIRTQIKTLILDSEWAKVVEACEAAMAEPCGRAWLDLQRYSVTALENWSAPLIAAAIKSEVRALLKDIPELRRWNLMDDTPTANGETQAWLDQIMAEGGESSAAAAAPRPAIAEAEEPAETHDGEPAPPDSYELALDAVREGRSREAVEILAGEASRQSTGRGRFRRKQQLAEVCIKLGQNAVAQPILEELLAEIDEHKLEGWEPAEAVAYPMTMLLDCMAKLDGDAAARQKIYQRICRLDPVQAMNCQP